MHVDWSTVFVPDVPLLEIFVRGSATYLCLFFLLRMVRNRTAGGRGLSDLLLIVLLADAVQSALAGKYHSVTAGLCLALTIAFWAFTLNLLRYHVPWLRPLLSSNAEVVVRDGVPQRRALKRELMTMDDLREELRKLEIHDLAEVRLARVEDDGSLTVKRTSNRSNRPIQEQG